MGYAYRKTIGQNVRWAREENRVGYACSRGCFVCGAQGDVKKHGPECCARTRCDHYRWDKQVTEWLEAEQGWYRSWLRAEEEWKEQVTEWLAAEDELRKVLAERPKSVVRREPREDLDPATARKARAKTGKRVKVHG